MANNSSNISNNSSIYRGLHHYISSSNVTPSSGSNFPPNNSGNNLQYHSQLFQNHMHQLNQSSSFNNSTSGINNGTNAGTSNGQVTTIPVALPAPVPIKPDIHGTSLAMTKNCSSLCSITVPPADKSGQMLTLVAKLWFEHNLESSLSSLEKDEHDKRIKDLRKQIEYIGETNWKYLPVDKFIGQT